jgi:hypothetical protein
VVKITGPWDLETGRSPCRTTLEINCLPTPIAIVLKVVATV